MTAVPEESLASLYKLSRLAFDELMRAINASNVTTANLLAFEDECSRLQLWGMNIGAGQYNTSTSLDFRLRDAETIRHQLRISLLELYDALQEACQSVKLLSQHGKMPVRFTQPSDNASPHDSTTQRPSRAAARSDGDLEQTTQFLTIRSDPVGQLDTTEAGHGSCEDETDDTNDPYEDLKYAFDDAKSAINSLFRMTLYIRNPSRRDQLKRRDISAVSGFAAFDEAHVEHKFPSASIDLTKRLGQANTVRRANIRYWERHHRKLALDETSNDADTVAPLSESVATAFNLLPKEEDLDDTRSHFSGTSYMSSMLGGDNTRRPDLPEAGRNGAPFQCPICYYIVTVSSEREWLKHVFFDLQPYVCLFSDCKTPLSLYENRHDWFNHVAATHLPEKRNEIQCPLCDDTVRTLPNIRRHLARHLEELALFSLPNSLFGEEANDFDDDKASVLSPDEDNPPSDPDLSTAEGKTEDLRIKDNDPVMEEEGADFAASDDERSELRFPLRSSQERTRSAEHSDTGDLAKGLSLYPDQERRKLEREAKTRGTELMLDEPSRRMEQRNMWRRAALEQSSGSGVKIEEQLNTVSRDDVLTPPYRIRVNYNDLTIIVDFASWSVKAATATVGDLRRIVGSRIGEDPDRVGLIYRGSVMGVNSYFLIAHGIKTNSEVTAILTDRPRWR